ncbi:hypothetical protein IWQ56_004371 [Coemansia nantahalensis]|uniref:Uncharacterized protein n=2 Tax=Coemansia TaxID=4863 RepID=A0ACC1LCY2_9FUNG|nr:hypothetical protein IWQ56_004371 [Coemansia nantahalensis]KAJ2766319.1 hypothetical protein IWQ57_004416 [Coemansia nantahalensis]KAJ2805975.1 hypothetical protein H4R21_001056 [Coemansia helicoidea]
MHEEPEQSDAGASQGGSEVSAQQLAAAIVEIQRLQATMSESIERLAGWQDNATTDSDELEARIHMVSLSLSDLDDNPWHVEGWIERAKKAVAALSDQDQLRCVEGKIRGSRVKEVLYSLPEDSGFDEFCTRVVKLLDPATVRDLLYDDIMAKRRYKNFNGLDAIVHARLDLYFLQRGADHHRAAERAILYAICSTLPADVARDIDVDLGFDEITRRIRRLSMAQNVRQR